MNAIEAINAEAQVVAQYVRPVITNGQVVSRVWLEPNGEQIEVVLWAGNHFYRVPLTVAVPQAESLFLTGGVYTCRLLWRYQDAVRDALLSNNF